MAEIDIYSDEWLVQANRDLQRKGCPACGGRATLSRVMVSLDAKYPPLQKFKNRPTVEEHKVYALLLECFDCGVYGTVERDDNVR